MVKLPFYIPPKIYKFMQSCWVEKFISGESVLLGTLDDFRNQEKHTLNKSDPMEGKLSVFQQGIWNISDPDKKALKEKLQKNGLLMENIQIFSGSGKAVDFTTDSFVFCASAEFDVSISEDLDPTYDICVEINEVAKFTVELATSLCRHFGLDRLKFDGAMVEYKSREVAATALQFEYNGKIKDERYSLQREYRLLFEDKSNYRVPIALKVNMSQVGAKICWRRV